MYLLKPGRLSKYLEYFVINYITYILFVDSKSSLCYLRTRDVRLLENLQKHEHKTYVWCNVQVHVGRKFRFTVKPVFRGHLSDKEKVGLHLHKTGDLLIEVQFIWNFSWQDKKRWPFNTGDCLIEVTEWAGLTITIYNINSYVSLKQRIKTCLGQDSTVVPL